MPYRDSIVLDWARTLPHLEMKLEIPSGVMQGTDTASLPAMFSTLDAMTGVGYFDGQCVVDLHFSPGPVAPQYFIHGNGTCSTPGNTEPPSGTTTNLGPFRFGIFALPWS